MPISSSTTGSEPTPEEPAQAHRKAARLLLALLVAAFLVRVGFSLGISQGLLGVQPQAESTDGYHLIAQTLLDGGGYRFSATEPPTMRRPPAYPAFLLAVLSVSNGDYRWVQCAQAALGALSCWLLFLLGRWLLSAELGLVAAAMMAIYPNSIIYSARLYAENLYFPAFLAFAYLLCRAAYDGSTRYGAGAGLAWGAGLLTRGTLLPLPLVLPLGVAMSRWHRAPRARWLRWSIPALLVGLLALAPWTLRNFLLSGQFVPVSSWAWAPMFHGTALAKHANEWRDLAVIDTQASRQVREVAAVRFGRAEGSIFQAPEDEIRYEQIARELTIRSWSEDPLGTIGRAARGVLYCWFFAFGTQARVVSLAIHLPLLAFFVAGCVMLAKRRREAFTRAWPALGLILYVNLFYALAYPHVRYMAPAIALSFVFAAAALLATLGRLPPDVKSRA